MRKVVTKPETTFVYDHEEVACDLCGFDEDDSYIFEVKVCVAEGGCAGTRITRDVCQDCYDDKLAALLNPVFDALKAGDPKLTEIQEDRWYG